VRKVEYKYCARWTINRKLTNVKIKITMGEATVELEAPVEHIEEAVKKVLSALKTAEPSATEKESVPRKSSPTCRAVVEELVSEGWFKSGRTLSETANELKRRGFLYDTTAIAHVLLDLVRERILTRVGEPRRYLYTQSTEMRTETIHSVSDDSFR